MTLVSPNFYISSWVLYSFSGDGGSEGDGSRETTTREHQSSPRAFINTIQLSFPGLATPDVPTPFVNTMWGLSCKDNGPYCLRKAIMECHCLDVPHKYILIKRMNNIDKHMFSESFHSMSGSTGVYPTFDLDVWITWCVTIEHQVHVSVHHMSRKSTHLALAWVLSE